MKINGETEGIRHTILEKLNNFYSLRIPKDCLWTEELIVELTAISAEINREIALYLDRNGRIIDVSIGDHQTVKLAAVQSKRSPGHLTGIRCIHTHPKGGGMLSSVDISSLELLSLDMMIAVGIRENQATDIFVGILSPEASEGVRIYGPYTAAKNDFAFMIEHMRDTEKILRTQHTEHTEQERAVLVGLQTRYTRDLYGVSEAEVSLAELKELAKTAGAIVVGSLMQKRESRDTATIIGQGKLEELRLLAQTTKADMVIFDEELSGTQQRTLEEKLGLKVLSRTSLILDIFAQRARSKEGILQVELAQLEYQLPRLTGTGLLLSRLGGGIGTRGPGETKLETDRRHIRSRIIHLKAQLTEIRKQRGILRESRQKNNLPVISLVGYTNAGKSTLLNALCGTDVLAEDKLFATLDPTTRKLHLNNGITVLISDTVGFIRKLPHHLLDAFKSTLEEVLLSDLILIVTDASDPQAEDHIRIVDEILTELGAGLKPALIILNKSDRITNEDPISLWREKRPVVEISALQKSGLEELKDTIANMLSSGRIQVNLEVPLSEGALIAWLHANSKIRSLSYTENAANIEAELDLSFRAKVEKYLLQSGRG